MRRRPYAQGGWWRTWREAAAAVRLDAATLESMPGPEIAQALRSARVAAIAALRK